MAKKNDWVRIHNIILTPEQRTGKLPEDTKKMPLEMWERGTLVEVNPCYTLNYGTFVPEILTMEESLRKALFGGEEA